MTERPPHEGQLSLIPYQHNHGDVVLRHGNAVVVVDRTSQQMTLRDDQPESFEFERCPYCKRSFEVEPDPDHAPSPGDRGFVNPDYFQLLAETFAATPGTSRAPSPSRPLRALRSGESRNVSSSGPPTGATLRDAGPRAAQGDHTIKTTSFLHGYFKQFFVERRELGRGGRGVVLLVEHVLDDISLGQFACKRIPVGNDHDWLVKVLNEVQLLQRLNHPNLVAYRHVWLEDAQPTKFGPPVPCIFILQQYCNAGNLHQWVQNLGGQREADVPQHRRGSRAETMSAQQTYMPLDDMLQFFVDITAGLDYLHANGWIHRDLKPSNCLLHRTGNRLTVLVSDFGEVQAIGEKRASTGATGTISYCAPEVLQRHSDDGQYGDFTMKSDVFSLGMILYYMCFARLPYVNADPDEENEDLDRLRAEIASWHGFDAMASQRPDLPTGFGLILGRLLSIDPDLRPTTSDILNSASTVLGGTTTKTTAAASPTLPQQSPRRGSRRSSGKTSASFAPRKGDNGDGSLVVRRMRIHSSDEAVESDGDMEKDSEDLSGDPYTEPMSESDNKLELNTSTKAQPVNPNDTALTISRHRRRRTDQHLNFAATWLPTWLQGPQVPSALKAVNFLARCLSLTYPCYPFATRSWIAYPLFVIATFELLANISVQISIVILALHFSVVYIAGRYAGGICVEPIWDTDDIVRRVMERVHVDHT